MNGVESTIPEALRVLGIVAAAALAAGAVLGRSSRGRAWAMLGALVVTPVLLVAEIWSTPQLETLRERPAVAVLAAAGGLALIAGLALLLARRPAILPVLALAALPFRVPVEAGGSAANLLVPLYVVIGAGALAWLLPRLRERPDSAPPPARRLELLLLGFVLLYAVQSAWSSDTAKALEQVVFFYVPFALLFALLRDVEWTAGRLRAGLLVLVGLALVFTAIGFWEYQARELLLNPKVIASNQVEQYFRVNSLFFDPNIYGRFLALVMIALTAVLLWSGHSREARLAAAALAVLWGGLLLTLSQSSFAALLAGLLVLAALRFPLRLVLPVAGAVLAVGAVVVLGFGEAVRVDLGSSEKLDKATSGRYELVKGGLELARERPLAGWGSGSFEREYRRHESTSSQRATAASHTIPVTVLAEQGVIGLAAYLALLAAALGRLLSGARASAARAALGAGFVALVAHTWLYAAFLEDPVTWTLLGVGAALAAVHPRPAGAAPEQAPARPAPAAPPARTPART
jgi:O-antigen ligase